MYYLLVIKGYVLSSRVLRLVCASAADKILYNEETQRKEIIIKVDKYRPQLYHWLSVCMLLSHKHDWCIAAAAAAQHWLVFNFIFTGSRQARFFKSCKETVDW